MKHDQIQTLAQCSLFVHETVTLYFINMSPEYQYPKSVTSDLRFGTGENLY